MQDYNFSYENSGNNSFIVYEIKDIEKIDKVEHNMITNNKIDGLLNIAYNCIDDKYFYKYEISSKIPLKRYIDGYNDRDKIIKILINTLKTLIDVEDYLILKEHIILDENYVFVDVSNISLQFICLPINDSSYNKFDLRYFINNIIDCLRFEDFDNKNLIFLLKDVINKDDSIKIEEVINVLKNINYNKIHKDQEHIEKSNSAAKNNNEEKKIEITCDILNSSQKRQIKIINNDKIANENEVENYDFLIPEQEEKIKIKNSNKKSKIDLKKIFTAHKHDKKSLIKEKNQDKTYDIEANKSEESSSYNHTILIKASNTNEQTSLLHALNSGFYKDLPCLIRKKNNEKINITGDLFRIGKEIDYVDYAIKDNNTISRAHADIIKINKDYYIQDNNSKNHTYVNNLMICDGQAFKLEHNFEIMLSDETFIFKLY